MTLQEKILNKFPFTNKEYIKEYEQIADDFAIGFKNWCDKFTNEVGDWKQDGVCLKNRFSTKELLQIYKTEKGL